LGHKRIWIHQKTGRKIPSFFRNEWLGVKISAEGSLTMKDRFGSIRVLAGIRTKEGDFGYSFSPSQNVISLTHWDVVCP